MAHAGMAVISYKYIVAKPWEPPCPEAHMSYSPNSSKGGGGVFPKVRHAFLGGPIIRTIVYWGLLFWGTAI